MLTKRINDIQQKIEIAYSKFRLAYIRVSVELGEKGKMKKSLHTSEKAGVSQWNSPRDQKVTCCFNEKFTVSQFFRGMSVFFLMDTELKSKFRS